MTKKLLLVVFLIVLAAFVAGVSRSNNPFSTVGTKTDQLDLQEGVLEQLNPLTIESLRKANYPGSEINIEQTLVPGSNYQRFIASYKSEGNKIYALLTIPQGEAPKDGWPVIIFNHGYIPPAQYQTTERYIAYTDAFSRNGYIVFRSDYRGHGNSEGQAAGGYGSNAYTIDVLNAVASIKQYNNQLSSGRKIVDVNRIGMWGHSMGGFITLRSMVVNKDIKAGVIWGGVVASYSDLLNNWRRRSSVTPALTPPGARPGWRQGLVDEYGEPEKNPEFWNSISANSFLQDISGPIQLHHGTADTSVPVAFSQTLDKQMKAVKKEVELYTYPGDDHDITSSFGIAMQRSVEFFDKYLK
jgi:dipeptidyl aminopeptidase/acylaminoacyl peptidase